MIAPKLCATPSTMPPISVPQSEPMPPITTASKAKISWVSPLAKALIGAGEGLGIASLQMVTSEEPWGFKGLARAMAIGATMGGAAGFAVGELQQPSPNISAFAASGDLNPIELADLRSTGDRLRPIVEATNGGIVRIDGNGLPDVRQVRPGRDPSGRGWIGLRANED